MVQPRKGEMTLHIPSPTLKAWTATCPVMPRVSAIGFTMGIKAATLAEAEGMKKFSTVTTKEIPMAAKPLLRLASGMEA